MTTYPVQRWNIGAAAITRVVEIEGSSPGTFFFKDATPDRLLQHAWLKPHFLTDEGRALASIHCFAIQSAGRVWERILRRRPEEKLSGTRRVSVLPYK